MDKLRILFACLLIAFNNLIVPIVVGEIGYFGESMAISNVLDQLPNIITNTAAVSAARLTDKATKHILTKTSGFPDTGNLLFAQAPNLKRLKASCRFPIPFQDRTRNIAVSLCH